MPNVIEIIFLCPLCKSTNAATVFYKSVKENIFVGTSIHNTEHILNECSVFQYTCLTCKQTNLGIAGPLLPALKHKIFQQKVGMN